MCKNHLDTAIVVDDDAHFLQSVGMMLRRVGFANIKLFLDAFEALDWLQTSTPCLIVSDLDMPLMTGCEFLTEIRSNPEMDKIPFILNTGNLEPAYREAAINSGANYLFKPYRLEELKEAVTAALQDVETETKQFA